MRIDESPAVRPALAGLLVAVTLVGLVVCLVTADIARANFSVGGLGVGYDR